MRLDKQVKASHPQFSWRQVREAIEKGQVTVDGRVRKDPGLDVSSRAAVELNLNRPAQRRIRAPFELLHEDEHILVLNKPAGLLSIPSTPDAGSSEDTVLRRVREYMEFKRGHKNYVGMLHRLDRDTSGALAVALSKDAHAAGRELFKEHRFDRQYLAIVRGIPDPPTGTISARISSTYQGGRRKLVDRQAPGLDSTTDYRVRDRLKDAALLELTLHTGRQHQIRLHLEKLGHPLLGERVYTAAESASAKASAFAKAPADRSARQDSSRPMLHAWRLAFPHPITGTRISVEAPMPPDFVKTLRRFMIRE
jgi:23S rRNA pseudouridine1911/1915/1917 synthase